ncbi:protein translocase subunit SecF [Rheinheimera mesophila]|uniref:Protein-export membrane protein SecF n=1 Tax=Rheinheimera mesophila TaxID=1547515 RepID=A0A3P3QKR5_9GAMM|nr:protein translocase subunit SecF [Rheinheimera mesophila]KKL02926.1 preprotein translocase subunit SecF [Rheinheimera mesophila]RRJ21080.1 protein translocase subunit SecF [Rheinheimera mesophila]
MRLLHFKEPINFMRFKWPAIVFSTLLVLGSLFAVFTKGINFGLDFTGGLVVEAGFEQQADLNKIRDALADNGFPDAIVQYFGTTTEVMIRIAPREDIEQAGSQIIEVIQKVEEGTVTKRRVENVSASVGDELKEDGMLALLASFIGIMMYVAFRFEWRYSVGAVMALVHDVIVTMGLFAITGMEFDLTVLAALLALVGYSINDTIVVFDRIREMFRKLRDATVEETVNDAITSTLSRTTITSGTTALSLVALFYMGGPLLHGFAAALLFGIAVGTYSSIFVASSIAVFLGASREDLLPEVIEKEGENTPSL